MISDILIDCMERPARSRKRISTWYAEAKAATWRIPKDNKIRFRSADLRSGNQVIFDIGGNEYRIIVVAQYTAGVFDVRIAGDHKEYNRVDAERIRAMTTVSVILVKTRIDHATAKSHLRALMKAGGHDDEIAAQARLIQDYEQTHYPIPDPDPIDALLLRMEQAGIDRRGLYDLLGASTGRVSEVLAGRRQLSISMIRTLHCKLGIPGDILIKASRKRIPRTSRARAASPRVGRS